ncbi:MAG TPA: PA14 domain-containing protein, partial [Sedimentisphaerales bacterium]|nr:PA14 domain-containing protein [Sedimentisphaerales bacterium]
MCKKLVYLSSFVLLLCLVGVANGTEGLKGEYYHTSISADVWQNLVLTRIDPTVNFDWGNSSPDPSINANDFTVRWTGTIEVPNSEIYTFHIRTDDGARLWLNNELIIDTWTEAKKWQATREGIIQGSSDFTLTGGQQYEIILEYYERSGNAVCELSWSTPTLTREAIPSRYLSPKRPYAHNPDLPDGAILRDMWVSLGWTPGDFAASHDVYFSDNLADVEALAAEASLGNRPSTNFVAGFPGFPYPEGLVPGTTYYWRIVEVNESNPESPWKGTVWSFMIAPKTSYNPNPADGAESVDLDVWLSWEPGLGAMLHHMYFGDNFADVNDGTGGMYKGPMSFSEYTPGTLKLAKTYYWRVDEFDAIETYKGHVWSFTTQGAVGSLKPSNGAVDVKQTQIITWSPSVYAASHELYFGTDKDAVKSADTGSPEYKGTRDLGAETYDPGKLEWDTTYYWRIDEVNNANTDSPWVGPVWSFTTANFL